MRFVDNTPRSAAATAESDAVCIAVDSDYVDKLSDKDKIAFGYILYRVISEILAQRLRMATQELMALKGKKGLLSGKNEVVCVFPLMIVRQFSKKGVK